MSSYLSSIVHSDGHMLNRFQDKAGGRADLLQVCLLDNQQQIPHGH